MNGTAPQAALAPGRTAMTDNNEKISYDENSHQPASEERFYFWLVAVAAVIFIFVLLYSQKSHGTM